MGRDISLILMREHGLDLYGNVIIANRDFAKSNPEAVKAFVATTVRGFQETAKDPEGAVKHVLNHNDVAREAVELERLRMALAQNIVTDEVRANGFGAVDMDRLERSIDQIADTYEFTRRPMAVECSTRSICRPRRTAWRPDERSVLDGIRSARHGARTGLMAAPFIDVEGRRAPVPAPRRRGGTLAVEGLSLSVAEGEFVAVVGPSGCGKSTLMKLVTGLQFPSAGSVRVAGAPVTGPVSIAGMAFQNPVMLPWRTTGANVLLPMEIVQPHRGRIRRSRAAYNERADALLASVGLEGAGEKFPWQLSGGMQQRASLCRALIHEPKLLMLDEPFAALDAFTREELWCVIRDLQAEKGFTTVLVTHDLREAAFLADRVLAMSARPGRILAERIVDLPRPRDLEVVYTPEFVDLVHELRGHIEQARR